MSKSYVLLSDVINEINETIKEEDQEILNSIDDDEYHPNRWTEADRKLITPCQGLLMASKGLLKKTKAALKLHQPSESNLIGITDHLMELYDDICPTVDDFIEHLYPPVDKENLATHVLKLTDLLQNILIYLRNVIISVEESIPNVCFLLKSKFKVLESNIKLDYIKNKYGAYFNMVTESYAPIVSGISPAEGPPGTIVKIRGENLGKDAKDVLRVYISGVNCTYTSEWKNSKLIQSRTGMGLGMGDIIVITKSGGQGTCLVKFRGYMPRVGLLTEAAVWVDESKLFEEKTTNLSKSRVFSPSTALHTDPLGVAPEETGLVLPADKIEEWYPEKSSNPLAENFNPSRFLLERHLDTSFSALKSGYYHLQSQDTRTSVGPTSFVRGNLTTILDALHTLTDVQKSMETHENDSSGNNICEELQGVLKSCNIASHSLFKDILQRKDEADAKRNVLSVLHRFRFLFSLPRSIEKNIQQGEYEILISDYNRVKALFQNTEVKSFKKALAEVDQKVSAFSKQLKNKLFDFPTPLEEQKKIIRYLNELDYSGDPGLECIEKQAVWLKSMLLDCQVEHQSLDGSKRLMSPPTSLFDLRDGRSERIYAGSSHSRNSSDSSGIFISNTTQPPQGILMVKDLCKLINDNLSDLWNLGQSYLSNQLGDKKTTGGKSKADRENFQAIVKDVLHVFCDMVQSVLLPEEKGKLMSSEREKAAMLMVSWLPSTVKSVRSTLDRLHKLGLTPDVVSPLKSLTTSLTGDCVNKVLQNCRRDIHDIYKKENWELDYTQKMYCTSTLPTLMEKMFMDSLRFVDSFLTDSKIDTKNDIRIVRNDVIESLQLSLKEFPVALAKTVFPEVDDSAEELHPSASRLHEKLSEEMRVLVLLSNCNHVKSMIIPNVLKQCDKYGFEEIKGVQEEVNEQLDDLDKHVFSAYIEMHGEPLIAGIEAGMQVAEFKWSGNQELQGVRNYIQEILMKFVTIHNQISSVSTLFIERIFNVLCELITDEFYRIFQSIEKFSLMGSLQAHLECSALKRSLQYYFTEKARNNIENSLADAPVLDEDSTKKLEDMLTSFQQDMRYQLATFNTADGAIPSDPIVKVRSESEMSRTSSQGSNFRMKTNSASSNYRLKTNSAGAKSQIKIKEEIKNKTIETNETLVKEKEEKPMEELKTEAKKKTTKRRAPLPPKLLDKDDQATRKKANNPFLDDSDNSLDPSNPFAGEDNNPFLDD